MPASIDFWFSIGSTYTYLSVMRIHNVEKQNGVTFNWLPFDVRAIMVEMNNVPFANKPAKERYMWRDVERRAALYALSWSSAPPYPIKHLSLVNRVATIGAKEGWCGDFVRAAYRLWFEKGNDPSVEPTLSAAISNIGQNPDAVIALAATDETKAALKSQTEKARGLGIFGSPTFVVEDEIFWGDDRLEDAVAWPGRQRELRSV